MVSPKVNRKSSFILFEGKKGHGYVPYQMAHATYSFQQHDERRLDVMRNWIESHPLCTRISDYLVPICGIKEDVYFELCCKIAFVDDSTPERSTFGMGQMQHPGSYHWPEVVGAEVSFEATEMIDYLHPLPPRDVLFDIPPLGTILPILLGLPVDDLVGQLPQRGDWVKFRNLSCRTQSSILEAVFKCESKISLLSTDTQLVKNCENLYEERTVSEQGRLPQSSPRPPQSLTDYEHMSFSTLREVLTSPQVTYKFLCLVRVTLTWPTEAVDFCALLDHRENDNANKDANSQFIYGVRFNLKDPLPGFMHTCMKKMGSS